MAGNRDSRKVIRCGECAALLDGKSFDPITKGGSSMIGVKSCGNRAESDRISGRSAEL